MSDPAYPAAVLPAPSRPLGVEAMPELLRTEMESGHVRQTQRFDTPLEGFRVQWQLNHDQLQVFKAWHYHSLASGARWFTMDLPEEALADSLMVNMRVRMIGGVYRRTYIGFREWVVETSLETEEANIMSELNLIAVILGGDGDGDGFLLLSDLWHEAIHTTLPEDN